jgi:hypothetical protein
VVTIIVIKGRDEKPESLLIISAKDDDKFSGRSEMEPVQIFHLLTLSKRELWRKHETS